MKTVSFSSPVLAVIGGSGLYAMDELRSSEALSVETPFGFADVVTGILHQCRVVFLPRHGRNHSIPPHKINYRANVWALKQLGATTVLAANTVGGIAATALPGAIVVPDQIIDYTYGRAHTFADPLNEDFNHIDFTWPYTASVRQHLVDSIAARTDQVIDAGVYAATQGPRLETAAEVTKLARDGCDIVGMTAMPEASLARELGLDYASVCPVVNRAAGLAGASMISMEQIRISLDEMMPSVRAAIADFARTLAQ